MVVVRNFVAAAISVQEMAIDLHYFPVRLTVILLEPEAAVEDRLEKLALACPAHQRAYMAVAEAHCYFAVAKKKYFLQIESHGRYKGSDNYLC